MAALYPDMPLNVQISQNFSKFLDMNIFNFRYNNDDKIYKLTSTLSWKKQNMYNYINENDNKCPRYKGAVIPVTMTRIFRRCTRYDEKRHHIDFILKILMSRGQCPMRIEERKSKFLKKMKSAKVPVCKNLGAIFTTVFDNVSRSHEITHSIIRKSARFRTSMIYKSMSSSAARICPKRKMLTKITKYFTSIQS